MHYSGTLEMNQPKQTMCVLSASSQVWFKQQAYMYVYDRWVRSEDIKCERVHNRTNVSLCIYLKDYSQTIAARHRFFRERATNLTFLKDHLFAKNLAWQSILSFTVFIVTQNDASKYRTEILNNYNTFLSAFKLIKHYVGPFAFMNYNNFELTQRNK